MASPPSGRQGQRRFPRPIQMGNVPPSSAHQSQLRPPSAAPLAPLTKFTRDSTATPRTPRHSKSTLPSGRAGAYTQAKASAYQMRLPRRHLQTLPALAPVKGVDSSRAPRSPACTSTGRFMSSYVPLHHSTHTTISLSGTSRSSNRAQASRLPHRHPPCRHHHQPPPAITDCP